jgi:hypothetical protein
VSHPGQKEAQGHLPPSVRGMRPRSASSPCRSGRR